MSNPGNKDDGFTPAERLQLLLDQQRRDFWLKIVTAVCGIITAIATPIAAYYSIHGVTKMQEADVDRSRIETKIDDAHTVNREDTKEVKETAKAAKTIAEETKVIAEETKEAVSVIHDMTKKSQ